MNWNNASEDLCSIGSIGLIIILLFAMLFNAFYISKKVLRVDESDDRFHKYAAYFEEIKTEKRIQL